ncbi:MAG: hypothetical protein NT036_06155 [Candidatus Omnitrophica bacterium]|nr:hypothetical protein [Candidatus Omnitrophota bacterium]
MRNIRARRRFKATLIFLLVLSAIAFFESRIEAFAPRVKILAEDRIGGVFGKNLDISIGRIDGGIVRPIALRNVKILSKAREKYGSRIFLIRNMVSNYRVWDLFFPDKFKRAPRIDIDFETKNRELSGFLTVEGAIDNAVVRGHVRLFGSSKIELEGRIKNGIARLILRPGSGLIKLEANFAADGVLLISVKVKHFKLRDVDLAGDVIIRNIAVKNSIDPKDESLEGDIEATNVIVNYKPFFDLKASYKISKETLEVSDLDLGHMLYLNGKFGLREPHIIDMVAVTDNMNMPQVLSVINAGYGSYVSGSMNSKSELKGTVNNLKTNIHFEMRKGRIGEVNFDYLSVSLKGDGPMMRIEDSRVMRESGPVVLGGEIDLRRIGKESIFENIKVLNGENTMAWDGWETAKWQDVREFRMTKNVAGGFNVGFKKYVNDSNVDESLRERDQVELGYNLHPNDSIKFKFGDNSNFFGLEHKDKF